MIKQNATSKRSILITDHDFDRLQTLTDIPQYPTTDVSPRSALKAELDRGTIVPAIEVPDVVVTMHSQVRVRDFKTDETFTYTLVYPAEADADAGKLSVLAPLGTALLGTRVGSLVEFRAPAGLRRLCVEEILYQPEAAGDFHL